MFAKKITVSLVVLGLLGVGIFFTKSYLPIPPSDPQSLVQEALLNLFEIKSSFSESSAKIEVKDVKDVNGNFNVVLNNKISDTTTFPSNLDSTINVNINTKSIGREIGFLGNVNLKIVDQIFYVKLSNVETNNLPEIENIISSVQNKWFALPLDALGESNPELATVLEEQKRLQNEMRAGLKNIIVNSDVFLIKNIVREFKKEYQIEVAPNLDVILTQEFLGNLQQILMAGLTAPSNEELSKLRPFVSQILEQTNLKLVLQIGKSDKMIHGYIAKVDIDLSKLDLPNKSENLSGTISASFESKITEINKRQIIEAPIESTDFDPAVLFNPVGANILAPLIQ